MEVQQAKIEEIVLSARQVFPELDENTGLKISKFRHREENAIFPYVPMADRTYSFPTSTVQEISPLSIMLMFHQFGKPGEGCYIYGPTGCGKSSLVRQFCSRCGIGLIFVTGHENMEISDLKGGLRIIKGDSVFVEGPLFKAFRLGCWFLLDEIDVIPPGLLMELNQILDGNHILHPETGRIVPFNKRFRFVGTANTFGTGQSMDYQRRRQDKATMNRFRYKIQARYPSSEMEVGILKGKAPALSALHERMVKLINSLRAGNEAGNFEDNIMFSTRTLVDWAELVLQCKDLGSHFQLYHAFEISVLNGIESETDRNTVRSQFTSEFSETDWTVTPPS